MCKPETGTLSGFRIYSDLSSELCDDTLADRKTETGAAGFFGAAFIDPVKAFKDPLLIFKLESVKLWDNMIDDMNNRTASVLMRGQIPEMQPAEQVQEAQEEEHSQQYIEQKQDLDAERELEEARQAQQAAASHDTRETAQQTNHTPYRAEKMPRPNDPCPCGSGKKFKHCHGRGL